MYIPEWSYGIFNTYAVKGICPWSAHRLDLVTSSGTPLKDLEPKKEKLELLEETWIAKSKGALSDLEVVAVASANRNSKRFIGFKWH